MAPLKRRHQTSEQHNIWFNKILLLFALCLGSGPHDHVFVYFTDHGAPGILAFPNDDVSTFLLPALANVHSWAYCTKHISQFLIRKYKLGTNYFYVVELVLSDLSQDQSCVLLYLNILLCVWTRHNNCCTLYMPCMCSIRMWFTYSENC